MATDHVVDKQSELSDSSPSTWNVPKSKMLIQFYKENRILWDRNHKDYEKKTLQKKTLIPLVAKLERSTVPKSEEEIKKRWHNLRTSALHYFKKHSSSDNQEKWAYSNEIIMCATNRRPVAGKGFASSTHGATCRRDMSL